MTPMLWTWLLSLTGAGVFFAAGVTLRLRRAGLQLSAAPTGLAPLELLPTATETLERELAHCAEQRVQLLQQLDAERERVRTAETAHQRLESTAHATQLELEAVRDSGGAVAHV